MSASEHEQGRGGDRAGAPAPRVPPIIRPLGEVLDALPVLARWCFEEWHAFDGRPLAEVEAQLSENLNRDCIPITFVAQSESGILGTISVDISDLPPFDHLSPWLASLYVQPLARGAGVGRALLLHAQQFATARCYEPHYLWTPGSTHLYERCGWTTFGRSTYASRPIALMRFSPERASG